MSRALPRLAAGCWSRRSAPRVWTRVWRRRGCQARKGTWCRCRHYRAATWRKIELGSCADRAGLRSAAAAATSDPYFWDTPDYSGTLAVQSTGQVCAGGEVHVSATFSNRLLSNLIKPKRSLTATSGLTPPAPSPLASTNVSRESGDGALRCTHPRRQLVRTTRSPGIQTHTIPQRPPLCTGVSA